LLNLYDFNLCINSGNCYNTDVEQSYHILDDKISLVVGSSPSILQSDSRENQFPDMYHRYILIVEIGTLNVFEIETGEFL